jgi:hypothetical protein
MKYLDGGQLIFLFQIDRASHFFFCRKCLCWSGYNGRLNSGTRIYCQKSPRRTSSEDENGTVVFNVSIILLDLHSFQIQDGCPSARCYRRYIACNHDLPLRCRWSSFIFTVVNVLRMIKLFGWERRVSERIRGKRNDELGWLWKLKVGRITFPFYLPVFYVIC